MSEREDYHAEQLAQARRLKRQAEEFKQHPVWQMLVENLTQQIEESRQAYERLQGRSVDELVKHEATRGAIASSKATLNFPDALIAAAKNTIDAIDPREETSDEDA